MLSNIIRAEAQKSCNPFDLEDTTVRYVVFYWNKYESGPNAGMDRENCFIVYEGEPSVEAWNEARYLASQLTK